MLGPGHCGRPLGRRPFSRSYGAILPSSLTMLLPSALGFSPHPPVSVYGTGSRGTIVAFLGRRSSRFATRRFAPRRALPFWRGICLPPGCCAWTGFSTPGPRLAPASPHVLSASGTGISTRLPSATPLGLALGPDFPRADQPSPGNLGYSAARILTSLSLLIPAFSLPLPPPLLSVRLRRPGECSPTAPPCDGTRGFGVAF